MLPMTEQFVGITHPLVSSIHMKKNYSLKKHTEENVLVIETNFPEQDENHGFDSYLVDLLIDLEEIKKNAEDRVGKFDRIDIRTH